MSRARSFAGLIANLFRKPVTVRENFGFLADTFRWLPRRDAEKCTGCGACNERCSTGATSVTDAGNERLVSIDSWKCIFCGRWADVCPEKALELNFEPKTEEEKKAREEALKKIGKNGDVCVRCLDGDQDASFKYVQKITLAHGSEEKNPTVDTVLQLQRCTFCGETIPVPEKYIKVIRERTLGNLKPETAQIIDQDMKLYLMACIDCRRKHSVEWNTHPRKWI